MGNRTLMRALLQRVERASVAIQGESTGAIGPGLLIFVCAMQGDSESEAVKLAMKIPKLRIFQDEVGKMNRSLLDVGGSALVVSQFTLAADVSRGNRPGFSAAAPPGEGRKLYDRFTNQLRAHGIRTETGRFGAEMSVSLINDGPVTIWMEI